MPTRPPLFQTVFDTVQRIAAGRSRSRPVVTRLATLVTAMAAAKTTVLGKVADQVVGLHLTRTEIPEYAERSLRNTLNDDRLTLAAVYQPVLAEVIDWEELRRTGEPVVLIIDESNRNASEHLLRCSLAVWGDALPLAQQLWEQNVKLQPGAYWEAMAALLAEVAAILPADLLVVVLADRAYDIPPFLDRLTARDWHYVVRLKANSSVCFRDPTTGATGSVAELLGAALWGPGTRWKGELDLFKGAGWRRVTVEAVWEKGHKEPVVAISDLPKQTDLLRYYDTRFWIEPSFKHDKSGGLQWEDSGVLGLAHQARLLVAMAWVTLLALTEGLTMALAQLYRRNRRERRGGAAVHAKRSLYRLGLARLLGALYADAPPLALRLTQLTGPSWNDRYKQAGIPPETFRP